jgi:NTE family protein
MVRGRLESRILCYASHRVRLEDFSRPRLIATCTDLVTKRCVALDHGSAPSAVAASCTLPGVATPVLDGSMVLVDGGVVDNCPCHVLRKQNVDVIVAVDVSGIRPTPIRSGHTPGLVQTLLGCWQAQRALQPAQPDSRADVTIRPDTSAYSFADFSTRTVDALAEAGRRAAEGAIPQLRAIVSQKAARSATPHTLFRRRYITFRELAGAFSQN